MTRTFLSWIVIAPALFLAPDRTSAPPERVQLTMATLHAAALTTSRGAGDTTDTPFLIMEVVGPRASSAAILPDSGEFRLRLDGAVAARPLTDLSLAAGDSVQVLVSVLESTRRRPIAGSLVAPAPASLRAAPSSAQADQANRLVAPLVNDGAHLIGSVSLMITNEAGAIYWRRLDCVASCTVLNAPATTALPAPGAPPFAGVVEFSGGGGTYHLALRANRAP